MIEQTQDPQHHERLMPVVTTDGMVDERETVFQVWDMLADRSPTNTATKVREEFGIHVSVDLVRKWAKRYEWPLKAHALFGDVAPDYFERTRAALVAAGPPAAIYLRDVVSGQTVADRNIVVAAVAVLDRIGFLP